MLHQYSCIQQSYPIKFLSLLSEYVCGVPVDYERADGGKCLELLSQDAYTMIKDAVFAELSATLFLSHSLSIEGEWEIAILLLFLTLSHSHRREEIWCHYSMLAFLWSVPAAVTKACKGAYESHNAL